VFGLEAVEVVAAHLDVEPFAGFVTDDLHAGPGTGGENVMDHDGDGVIARDGEEFDVVRADVGDGAGGGSGFRRGIGHGGEFEAVDVAEEFKDEGRSGIVVDGLGFADLLDAGVVHDDDFVGEFEGFLLVVGDENGGEVDAFVEFAEPAAEFLADFGVERAEGFVEQEDFGLGGEGAGEGDALALAAGELVGPTVGDAGELDKVEQPVDALVNFLVAGAIRATANAEAEGNVLENGQMAKERVVLKDEADAAVTGRGVGDVLAMKEDAAIAAGVGVFQAGENAQEGGLTAAGGAEEGDEAAGWNLEFKVLERDKAAKGFADVDGVDAHGKLMENG